MIEAHPQNIGQAARLWEKSGKSEWTLFSWPMKLESRTKQRVIRQISPQGGWAVGESGNKMPYFYKVLIDMLGMKEEDSEKGI